MSNVLNFRHRPPRRRALRVMPPMDAEWDASIRALLESQAALNQFSKPTPNLLQGLEQTLDAHRMAMLELAHKRRVFEAEESAAMQTATRALEMAAYKAMLAGVPESDIYALDETVAEALESAMNTVSQA